MLEKDQTRRFDIYQVDRELKRILLKSNNIFDGFLNILSLNI
jgi:hypothetical protein